MLFWSSDHCFDLTCWTRLVQLWSHFQVASRRGAAFKLKKNAQNREIMFEWQQVIQTLFFLILTIIFCLCYIYYKHAKVALDVCIRYCGQLWVLLRSAVGMTHSLRSDL